MTRANLSILINVVAGLTRSMPGHRVVLALTVGLILLGCGGLVPTAVPKLEGEICVEAGTAVFVKATWCVTPRIKPAERSTTSNRNATLKALALGAHLWPPTASLWTVWTRRPSAKPQTTASRNLVLPLRIPGSRVMSASGVASTPAASLRTPLATISEPTRFAAPTTARATTKVAFSWNAPNPWTANQTGRFSSTSILPIRVDRSVRLTGSVHCPPRRRR